MSVSHFVAIITHGDLGCEARNVSDKLVHSLDHIFCYSNQVDSLDVIQKNILTVISEKQPEHILILTDLMGGSCWLLANRIKQQIPEATVISGLNIPLLISYKINHDKLEWDDLIRKITEDGIKGIVVR